MNCTAEKQLSHGVFESFEIRKDSFFTVPQCEDTAPIQIGEILNNTYQITRFIAQGGMGIVYEGIDLVLHRKVAIKVLVTDFDDEEYEKELKLFQTEINLCGNLRHPNVIQIYYSGIHHRLPYLVMEYIEGIPINEYVMKQRRFNWNQKVKLISQVANGLAYIHNNNILHRDIKPSNILVKADGTPVLIDFGISIKKNLATVATNEGELSGTIHYMSPEQVAGEYDKINERSDIYSLGLILYELLIKCPAYTGSPNEIIGQIFNSSLLPPSDVNINIPETLSNITMKAIAKDPEDRYSTATEFIEDLRLYLKNENKKRVVKTVSLFEQVSYYLKPNKKIAVALGCIMIFFMAILNIAAFRCTTIGEMIHYLLRGIKPYSSSDVPGETQRPIQTKQIAVKESHTSSSKFRKSELNFRNTIEPKTGQNSNNTLYSQDTGKELASNIELQTKQTIQRKQWNQTESNESSPKPKINESSKKTENTVKTSHNVILNRSNHTQDNLVNTSSSTSSSSYEDDDTEETDTEETNDYSSGRVRNQSIINRILLSGCFWKGEPINTLPLDDPTYDGINFGDDPTYDGISFLYVFVHKDTDMELILLEFNPSDIRHDNDLSIQFDDKDNLSIQFDYNYLDSNENGLTVLNRHKRMLSLPIDCGERTQKIKKIIEQDATKQPTIYFLIAKEQCTQKIWNEVMKKDPCSEEAQAEEAGEAPATGMTLEECQTFCKDFFTTYHLPTSLVRKCFPFWRFDKLESSSSENSEQYNFTELKNLTSQNTFDSFSDDKSFFSDDDNSKFYKMDVGFCPALIIE